MKDRGAILKHDEIPAQHNFAIFPTLPPRPLSENTRACEQRQEIQPAATNNRRRRTTAPPPVDHFSWLAGPGCGGLHFFSRPQDLRNYWYASTWRGAYCIPVSYWVQTGAPMASPWVHANQGAAPRPPTTRPTGGDVLGDERAKRSQVRECMKGTAAG